MEEYEDGPDFCDRCREAAGVNPSEGVGADDCAGKDLAEYGREFEALEDFSDDLGGEEDRYEFEEECLRIVLLGSG